jgi:lipase chaperone LimK
MSIYKQMEDAKLTPEEIQELLDLLGSVLPKIEQRIKINKNLNTLTKNLTNELQKAELEGNGIIPTTQLKEKVDITVGFGLLKSASVKLAKFADIIKS